MTRKPLWLDFAILVAIVAMGVIDGCAHHKPMPLHTPETDIVVHSAHLLADASEMRDLKSDLAKFLDENDQFMPDEIDAIHALQKRIAAIEPMDVNVFEEIDAAQKALDRIKEHHKDVFNHTWS